MIAYLIGKLADVETDSIVIETGNIGYNVKVPASVIAGLPGMGEQVRIYTYTSVREDAINLFGFLTKDDLNMYRLLITVNGVGPKAGLAILSVMDADSLRLAVLSQDDRAAVIEVLSEDPRPSYQSDPDREYGMEYGRWEVRFTVDDTQKTLCITVLLTR